MSARSARSAGGPSFATANFIFDVRLIAGLAALPTFGTPATSVNVASPHPPNAQALFNGTGAHLTLRQENRCDTSDSAATVHFGRRRSAA
jgi:hypothetical protein